MQKNKKYKIKDVSFVHTNTTISTHCDGHKMRLRMKIFEYYFDMMGKNDHEQDH